MKKLRYIWYSFIVILPIIFIGFNQLDKIARAFILWTFILVYFSLKANYPVFPEYSKHDFHNNAVAFFTMAAYIVGAVDIRFLHITDDIPYKLRVDSIVMYPFFIIIKVYMQYTANLPIESCILTKKMRITIINLASVCILVLGQISLNSRLSLAIALPSALVCFIGFIKAFNSKIAKTNTV